MSRIIKQFHASGSVSKKKYPKDRAFRKLTEPAQLLVCMLEVEISTICRFLHGNGFSHQKMCQVVLQRDHLFRQQYINDISVYKPEMLIFLDETGADQRNAVRRYGYSIRGARIENYTMFIRGERMSAIAMMSMHGILDVPIVAGTTNSDSFYKFTQKCILPQLQPYNGINPHSVVVMDNCSIHHVAGIVDSIEQVGAIVHFLPPYSPDLNPIELAFSKDLEETMSFTDTEAIMLTAFATITDEDCQGWITHCGYN